MPDHESSSEHEETQSADRVGAQRHGATWSDMDTKKELLRQDVTSHWFTAENTVDLHYGMFGHV